MDSSLRLSESPTFLIVRMSAIGDCIETFPMATAIKRRWPRSRILWIVDCAANQLIDGHPSVDEVIRVKKGFLIRWKDRAQVVRQLRSAKVNVAIDPQGLLKSSVTAWLSGAKIRIGFDRGTSREGASWLYTHSIKATQEHLVDKQLELLGKLGIEPGPVDFQFQPSEPAQKYSESFFKDNSLQPGEFIALNPGTSIITRRWPSERFGELAKRIFDRTSTRSLILWGGKEEREMANRIVDAAPAATVLAPPTDLMQLAGLIASARILVSGDTGPMHLAAALGTQVVAIFGTTLPAKSGPYGSKHIALRRETEARTEVLRSWSTDEAVSKVSVEEVEEACVGLIKLNRNS